MKQARSFVHEERSDLRRVSASATGLWSPSSSRENKTIRHSDRTDDILPNPCVRLLIIIK